ncbi:hypothetical protein [Devriesea agamarum]|uniref:hypothetical protein n=1 Tax=Devriesea agamarum TaxID=472569 RepID=UPI00071C967E|nr:hypothetical protein [Devriesea agamarum]
MASTTSLALRTGSLLLAIGTLAACGQGATSGDKNAQPSGSPTAASSQRKEVAGLDPRVLLTFDGGIMTVDTASGNVIATEKRDGFFRLNNAGDGRHVMVSDGNAFHLFDSGLIAQAHGDHFHYYTQNPAMTGASFAATEPGHVVTHRGKTALFADGTGDIQVMNSGDLFAGKKPTAIDTTKTNAPHHGVAVPLKDGALLMTQGTESERHTVQVKDKSGAVIAETTDCPGVHGEAAAKPTDQGDVVALGCENGPVVYRDGAFHKIKAQEAYQRSGNLVGSEESEIVLGDYKTEGKKPEGEIERPTRVALIDTRADALKVVDLGSSYRFRSLARGPHGEALVLTYDGELNVIDPVKGTVVRETKVIEPWREDAQWQKPGPALKVAGDFAYVTDAASKKLHIVDIEQGKIAKTINLPETPNEIAVVTGKPEAPAPDTKDGGHAQHEHTGDHGDHEGHSHEGDGHEGDGHGSQEGHDHGGHEGHQH